MNRMHILVLIVSLTTVASLLSGPNSSKGSSQDHTEQSDESDFYQMMGNGFEKIFIAPGRAAMTVTPQDILDTSLSDLPILHAFFHKDGSCYCVWNYVPVTGALAAAIVYGLTRKPVRDRVAAVAHRMKKLFGFSKSREEKKLRRKVAEWQQAVQQAG